MIETKSSRARASLRWSIGILEDSDLEPEIKTAVIARSRDVNSCSIKLLFMFRNIVRICLPVPVSVNSLECAGPAALWSNREMSQPWVLYCL
jgi:hypothetical protein